MHVSTDAGAMRSAMLPGLAATSLRLARVGQDGARRRAAYDTGLMRLSIEAVAIGDGGARWGTSIHYAPYVEFGTFKMAAQPFVRPSVADLAGAL